jgi:hypothetical protein
VPKGQEVRLDKSGKEHRMEVPQIFSMQPCYDVMIVILHDSSSVCFRAGTRFAWPAQINVAKEGYV